MSQTRLCQIAETPQDQLGNVIDGRLPACGVCEPEARVAIAAANSDARPKSGPPVTMPPKILSNNRQACREAGLTVRERYEASRALHAEKEAGEGRRT